MSGEIKKLREEVQYLRDELAKMKRHYEDILYNLDYDNFSSRLIKEKDGMKAEITLTAEGLSSKVSESDMETAITQSAAGIRAEAKNYTDGQLAGYSTTSQTAAAIESAVSAATPDLSSYSTVTQTADAVESMVAKSITAYFTSSVAPDSLSYSSASDEEKKKSMLCLYNSKYYYFNDMEDEWKEYPKEGLKTLFLQTADGFSLTGNVHVSGDLVSGGTLSGADVRGGSFLDEDGKHRLTLSSWTDTGNAFSDLVYSEKVTSGGVTSFNEKFKIFDGVDYVALFLNGARIGYVGVNGNFYPQGDWVFGTSGCTVSGLTASGVTAVFG